MAVSHRGRGVALEDGTGIVTLGALVAVAPGDVDGVEAPAHPATRATGPISRIRKRPTDISRLRLMVSPPVGGSIRAGDDSTKDLW
jgi:hypothetical protein